MKAGLLEKIKSHAHWHLRILPNRPVNKPVRNQDALELVQQHRVSIRGWDFPHISNRTDDEGGSSRTPKYFENWTDWMTRWEFWRFYKSGQFIFMEALEEDLGRSGMQKDTIDMVAAIYTMTEYFVFAERISGSQIFDKSCFLELTFHSPGPRYLLAGRNRIPFFDEKRFDGGEIKMTRTLSHKGSRNAGSVDAVDALLEFFDYFGWNPSESQIVSEQENYFSKNFGY